jgi:hypothetical protein
LILYTIPIKMEKLDLTKQYKSYFSAKPKPELVDIEKAYYVAITGKGDPSGEEFLARIQALYPTIYAIKFMFKAKGKDFTVSKLEALWWFDEALYQAISMADAPTKIPRSEWEYRLLIRLPNFVKEEDMEVGKQSVISKKNNTLVQEISYFGMQEGKCVQMLHVGPFSEEPTSLALIQTFCEEHQLQKNGLHHEIYLSDFNKTAPEKLKTILREPVK